MKKIYVTPTLEVFEYIPEGQLLMPSEFSATVGGTTGGNGEEEELGNDDGENFGWSNKRQPNATWGKSPWE